MSLFFVKTAMNETCSSSDERMEMEMNGDAISDHLADENKICCQLF